MQSSRQLFPDFNPHLVAVSTNVGQVLVRPSQQTVISRRATFTDDVHDVHNVHDVPNCLTATNVAHPERLTSAAVLELPPLDGRNLMHDEKHGKATLQDIYSCTRFEHDNTVRIQHPDLQGTRPPANSLLSTQEAVKGQRLSQRKLCRYGMGQEPT